MMKNAVRVIVFYLAALAANSLRIEKRIGGGVPAKAEEFPHQASVCFNGKHECGGSILSPFHVLSAAHCIEIFFEREFLITSVKVTILVGSIFLNSGISYEVKRISHHINFTSDHLEHYPHDLSMFHTLKPIEFSPQVQPIGLPAADLQIPVGTLVTVAGFGSDRIKGPLSAVLNKLTSKIASIKDCYRQSSHIYIQSSNLCTMDGPGFGLCTGDAGDGLVDITKKTILGVVSAGGTLCAKGDPDIYTKVSDYLPFIESEMKYNIDDPSTHNEHRAINYHKPISQLIKV